MRSRQRAAGGAAVAALAVGLLTSAAQASGTAVAGFEGERFPVPNWRTMNLSDPAASGGSYRAMWANTELASSVTLPNRADTVVIRTRADLCQGGAAFRLTVGSTVLPVTTVSSTSWSEVRLPVGLPAGTHAVKFAFVNDFGAGCDRNLYLDKLTFTQSTTVSSSVSEVETWAKSYARVGAVGNDPAASGGKAMYLWDTGSATGTVTGATGRLIVRARGEMCQGAPQLRATASGVVLSTVTVGSTSYRDYDLGAFKSGTRTVSITFTNNTGAQGVCDRNVWVDTARVAASSATPAPTAPATPTAPTASPTSTATATPTTTAGPTATAIAAPAPAAGQPLGASRSFALVRADEFNGTSLDTGLWTAKEPWNGAPGFEQGDQAFCPVPTSSRLVQVNNGSLKLHAIKEPAGGKPMQSCFVTTRGNLSMTHGFVEARVKLPAGADLWPAFWLLGNKTGGDGCTWPCNGEIDIFEFVNNGKDNGVPYFTTHWAGPSDWVCPQEAGYTPYQPKHCQHSGIWPARIPDWSNKWITFGLERTSTSLTLYIDGKKVGTQLSTDKNDDGQTLGPVLFNDPMHIRFDNASSNGWSGDPTKAPEAGTFEIDYLRVWK